MGKQALRQHIDEAVSIMAMLPAEEQGAWIGYILERLEAEAGETALTMAHRIIRERFETGHW